MVDLSVRGKRGVDDDACLAGGAVAGAAVERLVADRVAERGGVRFERSEQCGVAVAGDRLAGRVERCRLDAGQRLGLGDVEDGGELEADQLLARASFVVALVGVAAAVADGGEDADRLLALADAAAELEPLAEAGDVGRVRALERDQQRVAQRVAVEARARTQPALPAVAREQGARRLAELVELLAAASVALLGSERSA